MANYNTPYNKISKPNKVKCGIELKHCLLCDDFVPLGEFHRKPDNKDGRVSYCKGCISDASRTRKTELVNYKGGKCDMCGIEWDGTNECIFDFHHRDPELKEFALSSNWTKYKCDLLCSNCHRLIHRNNKIDNHHITP